MRDEEPDTFFEAVLGVVAGVVAFALTVGVVVLVSVPLVLYALAYPLLWRVAAVVERHRDGNE